MVLNGHLIRDNLLRTFFPKYSDPKNLLDCHSFTKSIVILSIYFRQLFKIYAAF